MCFVMMVARPHTAAIRANEGMRVPVNQLARAPPLQVFLVSLMIEDGRQ